MKTLITICARGGSKGIPGKNIKEIAGQPLIYYTLKFVEIYKENSNDDIDVVLSTDSDNIKKIVKDLNFKNISLEYIRPEFLATDNVGKIDAINDVKIFMEGHKGLFYDYILDLDVTSPLRTVNDVIDAFEIIKNDNEAYNLFSVNSASRNPYFNMVEGNAKGYYELCKKGDFLTRQLSPKVYDLNASFYIYKSSFFQKGFKSAITDKSLIFEMKHTCFDLDEPVDFEFMEYLITNNKLRFNFFK